MAPLPLTGRDLTIDNVIEVARGRRAVALASDAADRMRASRAVIDASSPMARPVYGVNTGFGALADVRDPAGSALAELQRNLVRCHAAGVGAPLPDEAVRGDDAAARERARARPTPACATDARRRCSSRCSTPASTRRSRRRAPSARRATSRRSRTSRSRSSARARRPSTASRPPAAEALRARRASRRSCSRPKEGLALINGTQHMTAVGGARARSTRGALARPPTSPARMTLEALMGTARRLRRAHRSRRARIRARSRRARTCARCSPAARSARVARATAARCRTPYSLRCMPQVHGAARDALGFARGCSSARSTPPPTTRSSSPTTRRVISRRQLPRRSRWRWRSTSRRSRSPSWRTITERRIEQLVNPHLSSGLPPFLARDSGLHSRAHDRAGHRGRARQRDQGARPSRHRSTRSRPARARRTTSAWAPPARCSCAMRSTRAERCSPSRRCAPRRASTSAPRSHRAPAWRPPTPCVRGRVAHLDADRPPAPDIEALRELVHAGDLLANGATQAAHGLTSTSSSSARRRSRRSRRPPRSARVARPATTGSGSTVDREAADPPDGDGAARLAA